MNSFGKQDVGDDEGALPGRIRMLQAAFHVSYMLPTRKHWLQGVLRWLLQQDMHRAIDAAAFLAQLEALAKAFVLEVGSDAEDAPGYEDVVRRSGGFDRAAAVPLDEGVWLQKLCYGSVRLIDFNFLDYLLWLQGDVAGGKDFAFTSSRRSVEHLHPQTPLAGVIPWPEQQQQLHTFGNLCLVSHAMNSRLGNAVPEGKFQQLLHEKRHCSLKVLAMHQAFQEKGAWTAETAIQHHQAHMLQLLRQAFASNGLIQTS
ncbi:HNH endonuclease family protein [Simplicispira psychrophila]|uniref:HNH endonuclease family protein n=1 Tax=Simplicispira psychrophila TaxID=80882 RepID=UPI0004885C89|nr:HNH endonuclease family protein [Simplicispira psychrophila]